jgi:hypothetical protein
MRRGETIHPALFIEANMKNIIRMKQSVYQRFIKIFVDDIANIFPTGYRLVVVDDFTGLPLTR